MLMVKELPSSPEPAVAAIPVVLRERDQWVVWRYEKRAGRRTKIPYDPRTGGNASAADPGTWTAFDGAWKTFQQTRRYDGLAYVFSADDPFCGFDLDDCLDEEGLLLWGADLLETLDSYCEISPSGRGLKLIVRGKKPAYSRCKAAWNGGGTIEIYDQRRLFAITGQRFAETNPEIADRQTELDALCRQLWGHLPSPAQPREIMSGSSGDMSQCELSDRQQRCLVAMRRMRLVDRTDGSHRLYAACCRAIEHGLDDHEALACLRAYARQQPFPRFWSEAEMLQRLRDAERVCPRGNSSTPAPLTEPPTIGELLLECPTLRPPVIQGLLRQGETMNLIASPKTGKSWLAADLALMFATGQPLFNTFATVPGKVLLIDNELHRETIAFRMAKVADARGIAVPEFASQIHVESLRGRLLDLPALASWFARFPKGKFPVVILDSLYRMLPPETDENDNAAMCRLYNLIDAYAEQLGAAFILVHHTSKGNQSGKGVTDVGSGAGSISRATDSHLILRPHAEPNCAVLEAAVRSWPPVEPCVLRWTFPVWTPDSGLDPEQLRPEPFGTRSKKRVETNEQKWTAEAFVATFLSETRQSSDDILDAAEEAGISERQARKLLRVAVRKGLIHQHREAANQPAEYATTPFPASPNRQDRIAALLTEQPELSNREAARRLDVSHTLVRRVRQQVDAGGNCRPAPLETVCESSSKVETGVSTLFPAAKSLV